MATKPFLYFDTTNNYFKEQDTTSDGLELYQLTMSGTLDMDSGNNYKIVGVTAGDTTNDAVIWGQNVTFPGLTLTGNLAMAGAKITGLAEGVNSGDLITKNQMDNMTSGNYWLDPVVVLKMVDDSLETSPSGVDGNAYVVAGTGGDWSGFDVGDLVEYDSGWNLIVADDTGEPPTGTRVIVTSSSAAGSFSGKENQVAEYNGTSWDFTVPSTGHSVLVTDDDSMYNSKGYVYTGSAWTEFTGGNQITAGDGLVRSENTISADPGDGVTFDTAKLAVDVVADGGIGWPATNLGVTLASASGLEFSTGAMQFDVKSDGGLQIGAGGLSIKLDTTSETTLAISDGNGLYVTGLPSQFTVAGSAVSTDVTPANLLALTNGSLTSLHTHSSLPSEAGRLEETAWTATAALAKGDPAYLDSTNDYVDKAEAGTAAKAFPVGIARTAITQDETGPICYGGHCPDVISAATAGDRYYLGSSGGLTTTIPASGNYIVLMGFAVNATDLWVEPRYFGLR